MLSVPFVVKVKKIASIHPEKVGVGLKMQFIRRTLLISNQTRGVYPTKHGALMFRFAENFKMSYPRSDF